MAGSQTVQRRLLLAAAVVTAMLGTVAVAAAHQQAPTPPFHASLDATTGKVVVLNPCTTIDENTANPRQMTYTLEMIAADGSKVRLASAHGELYTVPAGQTDRYPVPADLPHGTYTLRATCQRVGASSIDFGRVVVETTVVWNGIVAPSTTAAPTTVPPSSSPAPAAPVSGSSTFTG